MAEDSPFDSHRAVRLLRAKTAELEARVRMADEPTETDWLAADLALIAELLADEIERANNEHRSIRDYAQRPPAGDVGPGVADGPGGRGI